MSTFFTVGHSNRPLEEFIDLLEAAAIARVADVRAFPRSRHNPHFNSEALQASLAPARIAYTHLPALGGRRAQQACESVNDFWENAGFRNYADYAYSDAFKTALAELRAIGQTQRTVIMCAEAVWWRCHRRIIADYLLVAGHPVIHLLGPGHSEPAKITPAAERLDDGRLRYRKGGELLDVARDGTEAGCSRHLR